MRRLISARFPIAFAVIAISCSSLIACAPVRAADSPQLLLGNPSGATDDPSNKNNFLMMKDFFALSYNNAKGTPNWVSWQLTKDDLGTAPRQRGFDTDMTLPDGFNRIQTKQYASTGFDRGHMCPHSDRAQNKTMSFATFIMTNIIPQAPNVNRKAWDQLEMYGRSLAKDGANHLYIISGPVGQGGRGSNGFKTKIGGDEVVVPSHCWKIIVVVPMRDANQDDLKEIDKNTRVIAVMMPNDNSVGEEWEQYRTSVDEIEKQTGLHFFDKLPDALAKTLKEDVDDAVIPTSVPVQHDSN